MNKNILIYRPQPVFIPEDAGIAREPLTDRDQQGRPLDAQDLSRFDSRTLFYDMFFRSGGLVCLGPPLLNLGLPLSIRCEGKKLRFRNDTVPLYGMPSVLRIELGAFRDRERLELEFQFRRFALSASCDALRAAPPRLKKTTAALVTLQKDNPVAWLRDWLLWHHRAHGIQRAVIYDNGSRYFPELDRLLADLDEGLEIILADWPFLHGPIRMFGHRYCQQGALNHFRLFFGGDIHWGVNLDIDEYLYRRDGKERPLSDFLTQPESRLSRPVIYLGSWQFPGHGARRTKADYPPRFFQYRMRCKKEHFPLWWHYKYIFQPQYVAACGVHRGWTRTSGFRMLRRMLKRFWRRVRAGLLRILPGGREAQRIADDPRNSAPYLHADPESQSREFLLCHFRGLYSGWRASGKEEVFQDARPQRRPAAAGGEQERDFRDAASFPADWLVEEPGIMETAVRVGLAEPDSATGPAPAASARRDDSSAGKTAPDETGGAGSD